MSTLGYEPRFKGLLWVTLIFVLASLTGCGGGGSSQTQPIQAGQSSPPPATPHVASTLPAHGASGVAFNVAIAVTFTADMDASTITPATFRVGNIGGTVAYDVTNKTAVFHPAGTMAANT